MKAFIKIVVDAPANCTKQELKDWVSYEIGLIGSLSLKNPLSDFTLHDEILEDSAEIEIDIIETVDKSNSISTAV